jgi:hypothetical protein
MLSFLPYDMLFKIIQYLLPHEFQQLYLSLEDEMLKQCTIECTTIVKDKLVKWFKRNHIKINLWKQMTQNSNFIEYKQNGKYHRDNDLPALIIINQKKQRWYQHGILHRKYGKPAHITLFNNSAHIFLKWYDNGKCQRVGVCKSSEADYFGIDISDFTL